MNRGKITYHTPQRKRKKQGGERGGAGVGGEGRGEEEGGRGREGRGQGGGGRSTDVNSLVVKNQM